MKTPTTPPQCAAAATPERPSTLLVDIEAPFRNIHGLSPAPEFRHTTDDVLAAAPAAPTRDRVPVTTSTLLDPTTVSCTQDHGAGY